jgi:hypothetical protein
LKNGANLKAQGGDQNNSALQISCMLGDLRSVRAFMEFMQISQQEDIWTDILFLQNKVGECALDLAKKRLYEVQQKESKEVVELNNLSEISEIVKLLTEKHSAL